MAAIPSYGNTLANVPDSATRLAMTTAERTSLGNLSVSGMLDTGAALTANRLYRLVSAGSVTQAQADTAAHLAGLAGISDSSGVLHKTGLVSWDFDAAPTVGLPAYPSSTLGKGSNTATSFGVEPVGLVVAAAGDVATVLMPYTPMMQPVSLKEYLDKETLELLGGTATEWGTSIFDDFDQIAHDSSYVRTPGWGYAAAADTFLASPHSVIRVAAAKSWSIGDNSAGFGPVGVSPLGHIWRLSTKARCDTGAYGAHSGIYWTTTAHTYGYISLTADGGTNWRLVYGRQDYDTGTVQLANDGIAYCTRDVLSPGDGTLRVRINGGAWATVNDAYTAAIAALTTTGSATLNIATPAGTKGLDLDWFYFRQKFVR